MDKVILVIDKPENCEDCPLFRTDKDFNATIHYCMPYPYKELFIVNEKGISNECPLKYLPKKKVISLKEAIGEKCSCYSDGWNDCLDEILGEEE